MEKIIQFHSGIKIPTATRHTTSPPYFSAQSDVSDVEESKEKPQDLSPVYKKKSHFSDNKVRFDDSPSDLQDIKEKKKNVKDFKVLQFQNNKFDSDESEPNSPETKVNNSVQKTPPVNMHSKFKALHNQPKTKTNEGEIEMDELGDDDKIKQISLFQTQSNDKDRMEKKKSHTQLITGSNKKDLVNIFKNQHQNDMEGVLSDVEKNNSVIYKEKEQSINNHPYRHLIYSSYCTESTFKRHLTLTYRGLVYAKKCLKGPSDKFIKSKQIVVNEGKTTKKKTLLLDLDETLIHTCQLKEDPEHVVLVPTENGGKISIGINIRPFCLEFLQKITTFYEVYIFTASSLLYATEIINFIDSERKFISGILVRENCMETKIGFFIKDLRIIKNRELKDMIIVDNLAHSFGFQIDNGVPILEFHNDKNDKELKYLCNYLIEASTSEDLREFNKKKLRLNELAELKIEDLEI